MQFFISAVGSNTSSERINVAHVLLLNAISSLQQSWRKGQNRFCLEARGVGVKGRGQEAKERNGPNNVCTYE
jgi:hypothetical protein